MGASSLTLSDVSVLLLRFQIRRSHPPPLVLPSRGGSRPQPGTTQGGGEGDGDALPKLKEAQSPAGAHRAAAAGTDPLTR